MRVVVATYPGGSDTAHLALEAEGVAHTVHQLGSGLHDYSELVTGLWGTGEGFVLVEHDIAPWAGAVAEIAACEWHWCQFRYPKAGGQLIRGLGLVKFSDELVASHPELVSGWDGEAWMSLDGAVGTVVATTLHREFPERHPLCTHEPPVAHTRRLGE